jgi:hypothetical protein
MRRKVTATMARPRPNGCADSVTITQGAMVLAVVWGRTELA